MTGRSFVFKKFNAELSKVWHTRQQTFNKAAVLQKVYF